MRQFSENFQKWNKKYWVHFSDADFVKINSDYIHSDPRGIYLFPLNLKLSPTLRHYWKQKNNKFIIQIDNGLKVCDFASIDDAKASAFLMNVGGKELVSLLSNVDWIFQTKNSLRFKFHTDKTLVNPEQNPLNIQEIWWELLKMASNRNGTKLTQFFVRNGYDAIFDDTGTILNQETQLIVFDESKIHIVKKISNST